MSDYDFEVKDRDSYKQIYTELKPGDKFFTCRWGNDPRSNESRVQVCKEKHNDSCFKEYEFLGLEKEAFREPQIILKPSLMSMLDNNSQGTCSALWIRERANKPPSIKILSRLNLIGE
jgi:hypothetical protein